MESISSLSLTSKKVRKKATPQQVASFVRKDGDTCQGQPKSKA